MNIKLATTLGISAICLSASVVLPMRSEAKLGVGQSTINLTPAKNTLKVLLGAGGVTFLGFSIREIDDIEQADLSAQRRREIEIAAMEERQLQAAQEQLEAEKALHKVVAEQTVEKAFAERLQQMNPQPAAVASSPQPANSISPVVSTQSLPQTTISSDPPGFNVQEKLEARPDSNFAEKLGLNPKCFMILGVPGSGKGMVVSHAIRALKRTKPHLQVVAIDPKDDPKETGYWSEGFNHAFRKNAERMEDHAFLKWVKGCVEYFKKLPDGKLLVFDEITATFNRWSRLDNSSFESFMVDYCTSVSSSGDSRENYVWLVGQIPHASALGVDGGIRSIYKPVAIVSKFDKRATDTFLGTKFIPKVLGGNKTVYEVMEKSPRGRAIYDYTEDRWIPMQEMKNYSGFDRDTRTKIT